MTENQSTQTREKKQTLWSKIDEFLDFVFQFSDDNEHIPLWASKRETPGFPVDEKRFERLISRSSTPRAWYFGTSTMKLDAEKRLFNRQSQFAGFFVLVFDDIGTGVGSKLRAEALPELEPSYRIETSPGNEQWGFVLNSPIRELELAKAFQRAVIYSAGADAGGCMPNKLVRLPGGVNLKERYRGEDGVPFACREISRSAKLWAPADLLAAIGSNTSWGEIEKGARLRTRHAGTTPYRAEKLYQAGAGGVVDPVFEWLGKNGWIVSETGEWITILCPWAKEHTDAAANTAGYSPIGMGERPTTRGFHCFHDACAERGTREFLDFVMESGGPRSAANSAIDEHVSRYALLVKDNCFVDMKSKNQDFYPQKGLQTSMSRQVWVPKGAGKFHAVAEYSLFVQEPSLLKLASRKNAPGSGALVENPGGAAPYLNTWHGPEWGDGIFDEAVAAEFERFIRYLIPEEKDATWFLDHLAAKAQDPRYRGAGVIMATPVEETGRGTLETIIRRVWGRRNVVNVTLSELVTGASSADNNSWITRDWIIIPEAKETDMSPRKEYTAYESLKRFVESGASSIQVKEKWAVTEELDCYGSVIVCSQHPNALPVDLGSTRFRRIENTIEKKSPEQWVEFYKWIESGFEPHVWRWLRARDLSGFMKFARQKELSLAEEIQNALHTGRSVDAAIALCLAYSNDHMGGVVFVQDLVDGLESVSGFFGLDEIRWQKVVRRELMNKTRELRTSEGKRWYCRLGDRSYRPRATTQDPGQALLKRVRASRRVNVAELFPLDVVDALQKNFAEYCKAMIDFD